MAESKARMRSSRLSFWRRESGIPNRTLTISANCFLLVISLPIRLRISSFVNNAASSDESSGSVAAELLMFGSACDNDFAVSFLVHNVASSDGISGSAVTELRMIERASDTEFAFEVIRKSATSLKEALRARFPVFASPVSEASLANYRPNSPAFISFDWGDFLRIYTFTVCLSLSSKHRLIADTSRQYLFRQCSAC